MWPAGVSRHHPDHRHPGVRSDARLEQAQLSDSDPKSIRQCALRRGVNVLVSSVSADGHTAQGAERVRPVFRLGSQRILQGATFISIGGHGRVFAIGS